MPGRKGGKIILGSREATEKTVGSGEWRAWDKTGGGESRKVGWGSLRRGPGMPILLRAVGNHGRFFGRAVV